MNTPTSSSIDHWTSRLAFALAALALTACPSGASEEDDAGSTGPTATVTTTSAGGMGGSGGEGGSTTSAGGNPGPCNTDCSEIDTMNECLVAVCNEGQFPGEVGACVVIPADSETECDDGMFCTTNDHCGAGDDEGQCVGGPPNDCDMEPSGACVLIQCDESSMSCNEVPAEEGSSCTPDDLCQLNGECNNGLCIGIPKDCEFSPANECNDAACDPGTGECIAVAPDPTANGQTCILSGEKCNTGKVCMDGDCIGGTPKDCAPLDGVCVTGECNATNGFCEPVPIPEGTACNDIGSANPDCNVGLCDVNGDCAVMPANDGGACDDYDACTQNDVCDAAGLCMGTAILNCSLFFEEDFEVCPPPGWTLSDEWQCGVPSSGPNTALFGERVLATRLGSNYYADCDYNTCFADTPLVNLSSATAPVLVFYAWVSTQGGTSDGFDVMVSQNGGQTYSVINSVTPAYNLTVSGQPAWGGLLEAAGYQEYQVDLAAYAGMTDLIFRIGFSSNGSQQHPGVYIDELRVVEADAVPMVIGTPSLPNAINGIPYATTLQAYGGGGQPLWSIQGGTNQGWLAIDANSGALTGTPALANVGPVQVIIRATDSTDATNFTDVAYDFSVADVIASDDFEACGAGLFQSFTGAWECGMPTSGPNGTTSGVNVLATTLAGNYPPSQGYDATTASTIAVDLSGLSMAELTFMAYLETEDKYDGFKVRVSTDGVSYVPVPGMDVSPGYHDPTIGLEPAWCGEFGASGYQPFSVDLTPFVGITTVYLQFAFYSDSIIQDEGVYIDDVIVSGL